MATTRPLIDTDAQFITLPDLGKIVGMTVPAIRSSLENAGVKIYKFARPYRVLVTDANDYIETYER